MHPYQPNQHHPGRPNEPRNIMDPNDPLATEAFKAKFGSVVVNGQKRPLDGQPQVGMIVLYVDVHGAPGVPAIVTAANFDGTFDITMFGAVTVEHKRVKPGFEYGQFRPLPDAAAFVLPEPVVPVAAAPTPADPFKHA